MDNSVKFLKPKKSEIHLYNFTLRSVTQNFTISMLFLITLSFLLLFWSFYIVKVTRNGDSHPRKLTGHHFTTGRLTSYFSLQARNCVPTLLGWRVSWGWRVSRRTCLTVQQTSTWCLCHIHTLQVKQYHTHNMHMCDIFLCKLVH